jgi:selenium metabolism protein YedF
METLDMKGQPCPIPVVRAKEVLAGQGAGGVIVLVDNIVAVQNLEKMAKGTGCGFSYTEDGGLYRVVVVKGANGVTGGGEQVDMSLNTRLETSGYSEREYRGTVVLITADSMGRGADELGRILIKGFIFSLTQLNPLPEAVMFLNSGARLTTEGANTIPDLKTLEDKGTGIFTCGTCANFYKLTEYLAVGSIVDMMNIVTRLSKASNVITI